MLNHGLQDVSVESSDKELAVNSERSGEDFWELVTEKLTEILGKETFDRWFKSCVLIRCGSGLCEVQVESDTHLLWIEANFSAEFQQSIEAVLNEPCVPVLSLSSSQPEVAPSTPVSVSVTKTQPVQTSEESMSVMMKKSGLNEEKSFDNYVVGSNNQFAHAACRAVVSAAGQVYNPLFIHCVPGLGKTHLVQSLGQEILKKDPTKKVLYLTGEKFTNKYIDAVRKGTTNAFRKRYRKVDVLILDDIQFLAGKGKSQEEFFHTFNTLLETQGQVVLTSDRPANEIQTFDARLSSRFEAGLTVSIAQPDFETRAAILQSKSREMKAKVPDNVLHFIAEKVKSNIRRLEGALVRAATHLSLTKVDLSLHVLEDLLSDILREENVKRVTIDMIQKTVADHFDIRLADMVSRKRPANIAKARQIAMFLGREMTKNSLADIGELFGGRDHGTVIHAVKKVSEEMKKDDYIKGEINFLRSKLTR